ncbi:MAG: ribonuclease HI [Desulfovibrio sp.]|nr:ribonuclease HI [Desulfovibrio sp.]
MKEYVIFVDGTMQCTPGRGAWAALVHTPDTSEPRILRGGLLKTTSNRVKLIGVLKALEHLEAGSHVTIYSSSDYICNTIGKGWLLQWAANNWISKSKTPVKNTDLWKQVFSLFTNYTITIHYQDGTDATMQKVQSVAHALLSKGAKEDFGIDPAYAKESSAKHPVDPTKKHIVIFTDGSCLGNPGPGGWAAIVRKDASSAVEMSGGYRLTTNNRMEILSVIESLKTLEDPSEVDLYSDSQYVCNAIEKHWISSWVRNNWVNSSKQPVKNQDLWRTLTPLLERHHVTFHWLRGHAGNSDNERCDVLARTCASRSDLPVDPGFEQKQ